MNLLLRQWQCCHGYLADRGELSAPTQARASQTPRKVNLTIPRPLRQLCGGVDSEDPTHFSGLPHTALVYVKHVISTDGKQSPRWRRQPHTSCKGSVPHMTHLGGDNVRDMGYMSVFQIICLHCWYWDEEGHTHRAVLFRTLWHGVLDPTRRGYYFVSKRQTR